MLLCFVGAIAGNSKDVVEGVLLPAKEDLQQLDSSFGVDLSEL